jgi:hypothetical protein
MESVCCLERHLNHLPNGLELRNPPCSLFGEPPGESRHRFLETWATSLAITITAECPARRRPRVDCGDALRGFSESLGSVKTVADSGDQQRSCALRNPILLFAISGLADPPHEALSVRAARKCQEPLCDTPYCPSPDTRPCEPRTAKSPQLRLGDVSQKPRRTEMPRAA